MSVGLELTGAQTHSNIMARKKKRSDPERVRKKRYSQGYDGPLTRQSLLSHSTVITHQSSYFQIKASLTLVQLYNTARVELDLGSMAYITM